MTVMGDTLKILLDYSLDQLPQEFKKSKFMGMNIGDMRLDMTQDVECIINDINSQNIGFKHLERILCPLIRLILLWSILVICSFASHQEWRECGFQSGTINNLYLNLGMMGNWSVNVENAISVRNI